MSELSEPVAAPAVDIEPVLASSDAAPVEGAPAPVEAASVPVVAPVPEKIVRPVPEGCAAYETLIIVYARFEGEALTGLLNELKVIFTAEGAIVDDAAVIGRKTLAYKIKKQSEGIYVNFVYTAPPAAIRNVERDLGHHEQVMRFMTTAAVRS